MMLPRLTSVRLVCSKTVARRGLALFAGVLFGAGALAPRAVDGAALMAQERGPVQRVVHGKVTDKSGAVLSGAVVYLEDQRTSSVKSAIADKDGGFRFVQLAQNTDYLLWAKIDGKKSPNKTISSFDSRNEFNIDLKIP